MFNVQVPGIRASQRGVALVLTLILLSVALVMALAFLAISGRERGSVTTQTDTATTRLAADAGLAAAEAQIAANILSTTNPYSFGLIVSTNYTPISRSSSPPCNHSCKPSPICNPARVRLWPFCKMAQTTSASIST